MRILLALVLLTAAAWCQRGGGMRGGGGGMRGGFVHSGGSGWRGGGFAGGGGAWRGGGYINSGWRGGGYHGGARFGYGYGYGRFGGFYGRAPYYGSAYYAAPWGFYGGYSPWFYGGYGYISNSYAYAPPYSTSPNVTIVSVPATEYAQSPVIVNDYVGRRLVREYTPPPADDPPLVRDSAPQISDSRKPILYLIASKSGTIWPAVAYWVEGGTLHYVTRTHERKQMPLNEVDRDLSIELNRERRVDFRLP